MKVAVFSAKPYDIRFLKERNTAHRHDLRFFDARLEADTAQLARGFPAICAFVNDQLDRPTLTALAAGGTRVAALRCTGFNNVDLHAAAELGITVARVPAYSPHAVAEYAVAMMLTLNRQIHRAWNRVRENNFSLAHCREADLLLGGCDWLSTDLDAARGKVAGQLPTRALSVGVLTRPYLTLAL